MKKLVIVVMMLVTMVMTGCGTTSKPEETPVVDWLNDGRPWGGITTFEQLTLKDFEKHPEWVKEASDAFTDWYLNR